MFIDLYNGRRSKWTSIAIWTALSTYVIALLVYRYHLAHLAAALPPAGAFCDDGIGPARSRAAKATGLVPAAQNGWAPRINDSKPPGPIPTGMIWIPGGQFWMGTDDNHMPDTKPWHRVYVDGFWMDQTEVTNDQFTRFVKTTDYMTIAERQPRAEDFPTAPRENLVAGSVVFTPPSQPVDLHNHLQWWSYIRGANWRHPEGPVLDLRNRMNHPVVHIAYQDAVAYCTAAGKRLPTEAEFEFASRGGLDRKRYAWGDELMPGGKYMANTFQGHFPDTNTVDDGYPGTAPVGSFPANGYGLYDMAGNVWEWTSDWYRADYYQTLAASGEIAMNPKGPADSFDPGEPEVPKRVQRGGSFLCTDQYCARYIAGGRGKGEPDTGTNHLGFRCVCERPPKLERSAHAP
jgi:sulfatase modifying factor 1